MQSGVDGPSSPAPCLHNQVQRPNIPTKVLICPGLRASAQSSRELLPRHESVVAYLRSEMVTREMCSSTGEKVVAGGWYNCRVSHNIMTDDKIGCVF